MKFYIINGKSFDTRVDVINYCDKNNINSDNIIIAESINSEKYFELQTTSNMRRTGVFHNTFLTQEEINNPIWIEQIKNLESGEYTERLVHLKEITRNKYEQMI